MFTGYKISRSTYAHSYWYFTKWNFDGQIFVGQNYSSDEIFVTERKIPHFRPTKNFSQEK